MKSTVDESLATTSADVLFQRIPTNFKIILGILNRVELCLITAGLRMVGLVITPGEGTGLTGLGSVSGALEDPSVV